MKLLVTMIVSAFLTGVMLPSVADAHTGYVNCDSTGVVFHYNANFERDTYVLETVGEAIRVIKVEAHKASTDTWEGIKTTVTASAKWKHGGIRPVTLTCPAPPPPPAPVVVVPPPAPVVPPPAPVVPVTPVVPLTPTTTTPAKAATQPVKKKAPKCPRYTYKIKFKNGVLICGKRVIKMVPYKPDKVKGVAKIRGGGVAG